MSYFTFIYRSWQHFFQQLQINNDILQHSGFAERKLWFFDSNDCIDVISRLHFRGGFGRGLLFLYTSNISAQFTNIKAVCDIT
ncbi:hypothetical protein [Rahnella sp. BIGb0603]|uniref:hypothetical protein n=1 Tax=Rahnella sp. BIGb0603 TaxID=2940612 RepID=UPI00216A390C|nr:hypothetical protein [Rahnella sp. BIGb0603]